jgi:hypothetical protein
MQCVLAAQPSESHDERKGAAILIEVSAEAARRFDRQRWAQALVKVELVAIEHVVNLVGTHSRDLDHKPFWHDEISVGRVGHVEHAAAGRGGVAIAVLFAFHDGHIGDDDVRVSIRDELRQQFG